MSVYDSMQEELNELVQLVLLNEQFIEVLAHGALKLDRESSLKNLHRIYRIDEISQKYGLQLQENRRRELPHALSLVQESYRST